ncbi:uncharacterized protein LOC123004019 isoform X2 [Tribolium madens]|uniref:uncharacterized protein LOC123004019 isoform X2 n=1 Tax=Tribolium madens TaxID=41895 RepID=UPI001CF74165|nr:uncharacterized protein LOC123004019 isoform X2 [Tribolium madens]
MDKILIFLLCLYLCSAKIKINKLDVPSAIRYGSQDFVVLDCDFTSGDHTVTEIKWFIDGDKQIYQWLPKTNVPAQALGKFKDHIDLTYRATNDPNTMYRALRITDLSPEFSGNYTCKVSGPESEDQVTKRMIIYETPDDDLELTISQEDSEIKCSAEGLFPEPNMTLYITNYNMTEIIYQENDESIDLGDDGLFNVSSVLAYDPEDLTETFYYICELSIPGTPFSMNETMIHFQDNKIKAEEDFNLFNSTNSTDSTFEESKEIETQIEEEYDFNTTTAETATNADDDDTRKEKNESSSLRHLPSLVTTFLTVTLLSQFYF